MMSCRQLHLYLHIDLFSFPFIAVYLDEDSEFISAESNSNNTTMENTPSITKQRNAKCLTDSAAFVIIVRSVFILLHSNYSNPRYTAELLYADNKILAHFTMFSNASGS